MAVAQDLGPATVEEKGGFSDLSACSQGAQAWAGMLALSDVVTLPLHDLHRRPQPPGPTGQPLVCRTHRRPLRASVEPSRKPRWAQPGTVMLTPPSRLFFLCRCTRFSNPFMILVPFNNEATESSF